MKSIYLTKIRVRRQQYQGQRQIGALSKLYASHLPMSLIKECVEINAFIKTYKRHPGEKQMGSEQSSDSTPFLVPRYYPKMAAQGFIAVMKQLLNCLQTISRDLICFWFVFLLLTTLGRQASNAMQKWKRKHEPCDITCKEILTSFLPAVAGTG